MTNFILCEGRHDMPSYEAIFPMEIADPTDTAALYRTAAEKIGDNTEISVYVTGLTVALGAVIAYCAENDIALTLMHYNRETGAYYAQTVISVAACPFCHMPSGHGYVCQHCGA